MMKQTGFLMAYLFLYTVAFSQATSKCLSTSIDGKCRFMTNHCEERSFTWTGPCIRSMATGKGKLIMYQSDTLYYTAVCTIVNGELSGMIDIDYARFSHYTGYYIKGKKEGQGTRIEKNGDKYTGQWKNDLREGQGTQFDSSGDKYTGQWVADNKQGQGTYTWQDGSKYTGQWKNDVREGQGTEVDQEGNKYVGQWKNDVMEGLGTYTWQDGSKYTGQWKNDGREGQGTQFDPGGEKYTGQWEANNKEGQGTLTWKNGDRYTGEFANDNRQGQGSYFFKDGRKYVGAWENNTKSGQGLFTWPNGNYFEGEFKEDNIYAGTLYNKDKAVIDEYTGGITKTEYDNTVKKKERESRYLQNIYSAYSDEAGLFGKRSGRIIEAEIYSIETVNNSTVDVRYIATVKDFYGFNSKGLKFRLRMNMDGTRYWDGLVDGWDNDNDSRNSQNNSKDYQVVSHSSDTYVYVEAEPNGHFVAIYSNNTEDDKKNYFSSISDTDGFNKTFNDSYDDNFISLYDYERYDHYPLTITISYPSNGKTISATIKLFKPNNKYTINIKPLY